jgi:hypothetical protein
MEKALPEWFHANQERVNRSGYLVKESTKKILDRLHPDHAAFEFSIDWAGVRQKLATGSGLDAVWRE